MGRLQLDLALRNTVNRYNYFDELFFWGKVIGTQKDYHIAVGIVYSQYEFPKKVFLWASSQDFEFDSFPELNSFHKDAYDKVNELFTGDPKKVYIKVEPEKVEGEELNAENQQEQVERDPLASTESEDESAKIIPINLKELDRLQYVVLAIENDC